AADIAEDIMVECLVRMRNGTLSRKRREIRGLVRTMARRRGIDWLREYKRRHVNQALYTYAFQNHARSWMSPELALEEKDSLGLQAQSLALLPSRCRQVYLMVRQERA